MSFNSIHVRFGGHTDTHQGHVVHHVDAYLSDKKYPESSHYLTLFSLFQLFDPRCQGKS